ncbi:MAG: hypothetical protein HYY23_20770 [Verrucomicrobia bacterium]|nr:hypothetical protein [Verrucomicrobiota bacterium]
MALLIVAFWAPVSMHCKLELVPGLEFLQCETEAPAPSDCDEDGCQVIESARYKVEENQPIVSPFVFVMTASLTVPPIEDSARRPERCATWTTAPPELPNTWQFVSRAALLPRAPSFAS